MTDASAALLTLAAIARPEDFVRLLPRVDDLIRSALVRSDRIPPELIATLKRDDELLRAAAHNRPALAADPRLRHELGSTGHHAVASAFLSGWPLRDCRTVLGAMTDFSFMSGLAPQERTVVTATAMLTNPVFRGRVLSGQRVGPPPTRAEVHRAFVCCRLPSLVVNAILTQPLTRSEQLRGLLSVYRGKGAAALAKVLASPAVTKHLPETVTAFGLAAARESDGLARLIAAVTEAESTVGAIVELRSEPVWQVPAILALREKLDWAAIHAAHLAEPFPPATARVLAVDPQCPNALVDVVAEDYVRACLRRDGAVSALVELRGDADGGSRVMEAAWAMVGPALAALVPASVAAAPRTWKWMYDNLPNYSGSVEALLSAARDQEGGHSSEPAPSPSQRFELPAAGTIPTRVLPKKQNQRAAFLTLLRGAPPETLSALLPYLDDTTAFHVIFGNWRPAWLRLAQPEASHRDRVLLSRCPHLPPEIIQRLAEYDDPAINAGLLYQRLATWDQRQRLGSGVPFGAGRTGPLAIDSTLRAAAVGGMSREYTALLAGFGDIEIVDAYLQKCVDSDQRPSGLLGLRLMCGVWDRHGPSEAEKRISPALPDKVRDLVADVLERHRETGLQQLRSAVHAEASSAHLARRLRTGQRGLYSLLTEGYRWDWEVFVDEQRRRPFPETVLADLTALPDCPDDFVAAAAGTATPAKAASRQLTPRSRPARKVLKAAAADPQLLAQLRVLAETELCDDQDAWVLAMRMVADFPGTAEELFSTAALACRQ